jgi:DNA-binding transcriptional LysR family regulator
MPVRPSGGYVSLKELRYFLAVAECLNFSRAADRCAVTQSTLSIQLRKLEDYLGVVLFERSHAHVALTAEGKAVLGLARVVITAADEIIAVSKLQTKRWPDTPPLSRVQAATAPIDDFNYPSIADD